MINIFLVSIFGTISIDAKNQSTEILWEKTFIENSEPIQIIGTSDQGFAFLAFDDGRFKLFKFDPSTEVQWITNFSVPITGCFFGCKISQTSDNGFVIGMDNIQVQDSNCC